MKTKKNLGVKNISVVIAAYNAEQFIAKVLKAIMNQTMLPGQIVIVDDGSRDSTYKEAMRFLKGNEKDLKKLGVQFKLIKQLNKGPAGASNTAIKNAKGEFIVSVDADAVIDKRFIETAIKEIKKDKKLGAVAGYIGTANPDKFWARIMGYDLEYRYDHIGGRKARKAYVDHVSPNNTAYRKDMFKKVGLFDERYFYAQDIEFSYRMVKKGYKIMLIKDAGCKHYWRETFWDYTRQQFNVSFWRLKFLGKNPSKAGGDKVAGIRMFMQVPLTGLAILSALVVTTYHDLWYVPATLFGILLIERYEEALYLLWKKRSASMLLLPFVHIWRNIVWGYSIIHFLAKKGEKEENTNMRREEA